MKYLFYFFGMVLYIHVHSAVVAPTRTIKKQNASLNLVEEMWDAIHSLPNSEEIPPQTSILDCCASTFNNPLQGMRAFTVFLVGYENDREEQYFIEELKKIGVVKMYSIAESIDVEGMMTGVHLMLSLSPLRVLGREESLIQRVSLFVTTSVYMQKTKLLCDSHVWQANAFAPKDKALEAVKEVLAPFLHHFRKGNPDVKPLFNVYM